MRGKATRVDLIICAAARHDDFCTTRQEVVDAGNFHHRFAVDIAAFDPSFQNRTHRMGRVELVDDTLYRRDPKFPQRPKSLDGGILGVVDPLSVTTSMRMRAMEGGVGLRGPGVVSAAALGVALEVG